MSSAHTLGQINVAVSTMDDCAIGAFGVVVETLLALVGLGHGLENPLAASLRAHGAGPGLAVPENVLALYATVCVAELHKVSRVDADLSQRRRWCCLG